MRIGIDISQIVYGTGVSVYTKNLVENLLKIDRGNEYLLFAGTLRRRRDILGVFPLARVFPIPPTLADFIWNRFHFLPVEKLIGQVNVFHSSDWTQPPSKAFKVTTVHDLIPLKFPKLIHPAILAVHKRRLEWVKKEADRVIVPSNCTKEDLVAYGIYKEKIRVIYEAAVFSRVSQAVVDRVKKKYKINTKYLFAVGLSPYKNIERIIKAFDLVGGGRDLKLVIAGRCDSQIHLERRGVRFLGAVSDKELSALLTEAEVLVFPSLYEGFGLPVLDAFACETPVVTSNISSLPEVAGAAAVLVDPYDVNSIAEGIQTALRSRKGLIEKGLRRVKGFSWEKTAKETLGVYKEAVSRV